MSASVPGERPWRVAVIGSGPSGMYAAAGLLDAEDVPVTVDVIDRLPTPYGLVRYGVAPDHARMKNVIGTLQRTFERPGCRFLGAVDIGADPAKGLTREDLVRHYDAVVWATGATVDRSLGIPGEDLPGSVSATDFVAWYSGHPDALMPFDPRTTTSVVVVGAGNVAVDVVRVLAKSAAELAATDVPEPVVEVLRGSAVRDLHLLARRGPLEAKFTPKELGELGELANAAVLVDPVDVADVEVPDELGKQVRTNVEHLRAWAHTRDSREASTAPRRLHLHFWTAPVRVLGEAHVTGVEVERTRLDGGRLVMTGERRELAAQAVLRAVGYRSLPVPGLPFDEATATVPHDAGRVVAGGSVQVGDYVTGWLKRGPTGVIGTNKRDGQETAASLLADIASGALVRRAVEAPVDAVLDERSVEVVGYEGWLAIDAAEVAAGPPRGADRVKVADWPRLRSLASRDARI